MSDAEEITHLRQLIDIYKRNIFQIEREEAMHGLSSDSYYVSSEWAAKNNLSDPESKAKIWQDRIKQTVAEIQRKYGDLDIQFRFHKLPFAWRIWIGDQVVFVSMRLKGSGNDLKVSVFQFDRSADLSKMGMFEMFESYFDRTWEDAES